MVELQGAVSDRYLQFIAEPVIGSAKGGEHMNDSDEPGDDQQPPGGRVLSERADARGAKLRELLQRRQAARAESAQQASAGPAAEGNSPSGLNRDEPGKFGQAAVSGGEPQAGGGQLLRALAERGGGAPQAGGGRLLRALAERGGGGGAQPGGGGRLLRALAQRAGGDASQAGGGRLLQALAGRAGGGGGGAQAAGKGAGTGNRGTMLRRMIQSRGDPHAQPGQDGPQLTELQDRVRQLTEEVERLRAGQVEQTPAASQSVAVGAKRKAGVSGKKARLGGPRAGTHKR